MTIEEMVHQHLTECGMWPEDATQVIQVMKTDPRIEHFDRWQKEMADYPGELWGLLLMLAQLIALEWVDANCPEAFYRPMLVITAQEVACS